MSEDDKKLYEIAKQHFNIDSLEQLALILGYAKTTVNNWYKSGFNKVVRLKINAKLQEYSINTMYLENSNSLNKDELSELENDLIKSFRELEENDKEIFYFEIKAAAAKARKKIKELNSIEDTKSVE